MRDRCSLNRSSTRILMRALRTGVALAALCSLALIAAGCGSSKKTTTTTTAAKPAISKAQFLAQGNAICADGNRKLAVQQRALEKLVGNKPPTDAQVAAYVKTTFIPAIQAQIDRLRALGTPAGEESAVTHILDAAQSDLNSVKGNALLLVNDHPFASFARGAHPYGLKQCAKKA
jgi:hypothetical protein